MRLALAFLLAGSLAAPAFAQSLVYPPTTKGPVVDDYFGTKVPDPYRWLEDLESPETAKWVAAENQVTYAYLDQLPQREPIRKRLTELWNYQRTNVPVREAGQIWFRQNSGLQRQSVLYRQSAVGASPALALDPNVLSPDGSVAMAQWAPSPDGKWLAYTSAAGGSDVKDIHLRNLGSGKDAAEAVLHVKFTGMAWTRDSKGFFYSRYKGTETAADFAKASEHHQVWYHPLGAKTPDRLIFERPEQPREGTWASVSDDGTKLFLSTSSGATGSRLWIADLGTAAKPNLAAKPVVVAAEDDAHHNPLGVVDRTVYLYTTFEAPKGRIVSTEVGNSDRSKWKTVVPQSEAPISETLMIGNRLVVIRLVDVQSRVQVYGLDGASEGEIALPEPGTADELSGRTDGTDFFLSFTSYLRPRTVYRCDPAKRTMEPFYAPKSPFDASQYETRALFYNSKDGTRVPLFVTLKKGVTLDGSHPTILHGYGGFNVPELPAYTPAVAGWLDMGGVYAVANIRGGSEYGEAWHQAGVRDRKQNVFDDFIAAAEYLIRERYTTSSRLGIQGGSNGGLLVGACMIQRPDLFAVALPAVGVMDMMRFHKFTAGPFWTEDYGSSDDAAGAKYILAYSPLQNLKPGSCYPATLVTTADRDDRVVPSHSFKFAAMLQAVQTCAKPALIRVEVAGSHGYRPTDRIIAEVADEYAFALANMELPK